MKKMDRGWENGTGYWGWFWCFWEEDGAGSGRNSVLSRKRLHSI